MLHQYAHHRDEHVDAVRTRTDAYLEEHPALAERMSSTWWVHHFLLDLAPITPENFGSGHLLALIESEYELASSGSAARFGLYKQAMVALRSVLELGLLYIYWDTDDDAHRAIQNWLRGSEQTPHEREVRKGLARIPGVARYLEHDPRFLDDLQHLSFELGAFVHTRGRAGSIRGLNPTTNFPSFSATAFERWVEMAERVVRGVTALHLMKYPIGLQVTPLSEKFGLNPPAGGFVEPAVRDRFRDYLDPDMRDRLQLQSDDDPAAVAMREQIDAMPDLTEDDWRDHLRAQDQFLIEGMGYEAWRASRSIIRDHLDDAELAAREAYEEELRQWAVQEGCVDGPPQRPI
ncbi:hypothetical protein [Microbacterium trichothecenolyticum]|uniref:Uncharacterized protein n=1 Tax=Microbacterium trichothecenolyticum TaxID=69370 RepID=A0ABU0TQX7_MICTR|nr:hypothetical protein [Microbacterium trichothecenolyticum]MDQ1122073.1 hypothetical protein [Microbacterium trichothecenolyticum]